MKLRKLIKNMAEDAVLRLYEDGVIYFEGTCGENRELLKGTYGDYKVAEIEPGFCLDCAGVATKVSLDIVTRGHADET